MKTSDLLNEVKNGGKLVVYPYTISILVMTFKRSSPIHFYKAGENRIKAGLGYLLLTLLLGWWGFPWGPIYSIQTIFQVLSGGKDVTDKIVSNIVAVAKEQEKERSKPEKITKKVESYEEDSKRAPVND